MVNQVIDLTSTGLVISNLVLSDTSNPHIAWCKKISNNVDVDTIGTTLIERGSGIYVITNPNVLEDTDFRVYVATDATKYAVGIFSPADGDIALNSTVAKETTVNTKLDASAYIVPDNSSVLLVKAKTDTINWTDVTSRLASVDYVAPDNSNITLIKAKTDTINWLDIDRLLGLTLENSVEDDIIRDSNGNKTSSVIYLYDSAANADIHNKITGVINTYNVTATYIANKLSLFRMTLE